MYRIAQLIIHVRWLLLAALACLLALGYIPLKTLYFDNSTDSFFLEGDQNLRKYQEFLDAYDTDEYAVVMLHLGPQWSQEELLQVAELTSAIASLENVNEVTSVTNVFNVRGEGDEISVQDLFPVEELKQGRIDIDAVREEAINNPLYRGLFVSGDGEYVSIVVKTPVHEGQIDYKIALTASVKELIGGPAYSDLSPVVVGAPVLDAMVREMVSRESGIFMAAAIFVVATGYWLIFRSVLAVALPIGISLIATYAAFCLSALIGAPLGLLSSIVPAFLISVGSTASIYLQTELFVNAKKPMGSMSDRISSAFANAALPSILAGATTVGSLLAFAASSVKPVMDVGITMGLGLAVAVLLTMIIVPIAYSFRRDWSVSANQIERLSGRTERMAKLADYVFNNRKLIAVVAVAVLATGLYGVSSLRVDYYYLGTFKDRVEVKQSFRQVDSVLGNSSSIEIVVHAAEDRNVRDIDVQRYAEGLVAHIEAYPRGALTTRSSIEVVKEVNKAFNGGDAEYYRIPNSEEKLSALLFLFELGGGRELSKLFSMNDEMMRITVFLPNQENSRNVDAIRHIQEYIGSHPYRGADIAGIEVTGLIPLWAAINEYLIDSQIKSVILAFLIVTIVMCALFRSLKLGVLMAIGNTIAVVSVLGFMGYAGILLDPYTILVSAIALGIMDDDTIHFVKVYQSQLAVTGRRYSALVETFRTTGQAIFYFSTTLAAAFLVYLFSDVQSLSNFGLVVAITILAGLLVELFVNPTILLLVTRDVAVGVQELDSDKTQVFSG